MPRPATGQVIERKTQSGRVLALRFRAYGRRQYLTLGAAADGWDRRRAEEELANVLADVRRGIWQPPAAATIVDEPQAEETFHEYASRWVEDHRHEVDDRTVEFWRWALSHVLAHLAALPLSAITVERIDAYKGAKVREREYLLGELHRWQKEKPETRGPRPPRPLSNASINRTVTVLAGVLETAVEHGRLPANPARGKRRRLKAAKPRRTWLALDEVRSLLDASPLHRALLATLILAGLRVGELCALRWRAVDLARGTLTVEESKTDAGEGRVIDLSPDLRETLTLHRAALGDVGDDDLVYPTRTGGQRDRHNVRSRILLPSIERANKQRVEVGLRPIADGITNHTCRRTFASLLYEAGASPAYVMSQMGHESAALALEVYAKVMDRKRETGARMDELIRAADWAPSGTSDPVTDEAVSVLATENPA